MKYSSMKFISCSLYSSIKSFQWLIFFLSLFFFFFLSSCFPFHSLGRTDLKGMGSECDKGALYEIPK